MYFDDLKKVNVAIHIITTGAGAGLQQLLWAEPGSSAYLSGCSMPYDGSGTEELLGFKPESFVSQETAIDLASVAYMKAYKFGGKRAVGIGLTASVASTTAHKGDHRVDVCVITDTKVLTRHIVLNKDVGILARTVDGLDCDYAALDLLLHALDIQSLDLTKDNAVDATELALTRFFKRSFFMANGKRLESIPHNDNEYCAHHPYALMPGAFNPPHDGHFGVARSMLNDYGMVTVFEVTANPPHKAILSLQELLQRAKLLQGYDRVFTQKEPLYLDKAKAFKGIPLVVGADAMVRMLDPKWGVDIKSMLNEYLLLNTRIYINGRVINDKFVSRDDIYELLPQELVNLFKYLTVFVSGRYEMSSTEIRNKLNQ